MVDHKPAVVGATPGTVTGAERLPVKFSVTVVFAVFSPDEG